LRFATPGIFLRVLAGNVKLSIKAFETILLFFLALSYFINILKKTGTNLKEIKGIVDNLNTREK